MSANTQPNIVIRPATPNDAAVCGQICYDAFSTLNAAHNFPADFPTPEVAIGLMTWLFSAPGIHRG